MFFKFSMSKNLDDIKNLKTIGIGEYILIFPLTMWTKVGGNMTAICGVLRLQINQFSPYIKVLLTNCPWPLGHRRIMKIQVIPTFDGGGELFST